MGVDPKIKVVATSNQEKALVGEGVITNLWWNFLKHYSAHYLGEINETPGDLMNMNMNL